MGTSEDVASFEHCPFWGPVTETLQTGGDGAPRPVARAEDGEGRTVSWYRIENILGRGGVGIVYKAWDCRLERHVALKVLAGVEASSALLEEARRQVEVEHPHICPVHRVVEIAGTTCLEMRYVPGVTLEEATRTKRLDQRALVECVRQAALGLAAAHGKGVVHRDIKPSNILVDLSGENTLHAYLSDFGIAVGSDGSDRFLRREIGTRGFMAPEQARDGKVSRQSDIYSLGATLYAVLAGRPPLTSEEQKAAVRDGLWPIRPLREVAPSIQWELEAIVMRCLEENPKHRFSSARELAEELDRWLKGKPVRTTASTLRGRLRLFWHRHRLASLALLGLATVATAAVITWAWAWHRAALREQAQRAVASELEDLRRSHLLEQMLPFHDLAEGRARLVRRIQRLHHWERRWGRPGRPVVLAGEGEAWLEIGETVPARRALEFAEREGLEGPELQLLRARLLLREFLRRVDQARAVLRSHEREVEVARLERQLFRPAMDLLAAAGEPVPLEAEVNRLLAKGNSRGAMDLLDSPSLRVPRQERDALKGRVWLHVGRERSGAGERDGALRALKAARKHFLAAITAARSGPAGYMGLCATDSELLWLAVQGGDAASFGPASRHAQKSCREALEVDSSAPGAWAALALLHLRLAEWERSCSGEAYGLPPEEELLHRAVREARRARSLDPEAPIPRLLAVEALNRIAFLLWKTDHFDGQATWLREALREGRELTRKIPDSAVAWHALGATRRMVADLPCGNAPAAAPLPCGEATGLAIRALERAVELDPAYPVAWKDLGYVKEIQGLRELYLSPAASLSHLTAAVAASARAVELKPCYYDALDNLAQSLEGIGWWAAARGGDPMPWLRSASRVFAWDHRCAPSRPYPIANGSGLWLKVGWFQARTGASPEEALRKTESVRRWGSDARWEAWWRANGDRGRGEMHLVRALDRLNRGLDGGRELISAARALHGSLGLEHCQVAASQQFVLLLQAIRDGRPPGAAAAHCRRAEEHVWEALDGDAFPGLHPLGTWLVSPDADLLEARWLLDRGRDPTVPMEHLRRCLTIMRRRSRVPSGMLLSWEARLLELTAETAKDADGSTTLRTVARALARMAVTLDRHRRFELRDLLDPHPDPAIHPGPSSPPRVRSGARRRRSSAPGRGTTRGRRPGRRAGSRGSSWR